MGHRLEVGQALESLREYGLSDTKILEHLLFNYLSAHIALGALEDLEEEVHADDETSD